MAQEDIHLRIFEASIKEVRLARRSSSFVDTVDFRGVRIYNRADRYCLVSLSNIFSNHLSILTDLTCRDATVLAIAAIF